MPAYTHMVLPIYQAPETRQRLFEYLGGESLETATASYIAHTDTWNPAYFETSPVSHLEEYLDQGWDIDRSLLDRESLLAHLDLEYVNFDSPAECYLNPHHSFTLQEPVIRVIHEVLLHYGIRPLHLLTGQGHHFVWRMERSSPLINILARLAPRNHAHPAAPDGDDESMHWREPFLGLGLVMEFLAEQIKRIASPQTHIPIELTALHVGRNELGKREMISIDISEYGDPLWTRVIRMPFTNYLKPWSSGLVESLGITDYVPPIFIIPFHEMDLSKALEIRTNPEEVRILTKRACVRIPEQSQGMAHLIADYQNSSLRSFHESYDQADINPDLDLPSLLDQIPPCARHIIEDPNDLLLKPSGMKLITRCLLALEVPPYQVAEMISQVFRDPTYNWQQWKVYSPEMRAHFYTRIFTGQMSTGLDHHLDFNCVSLQDQGFCFDAQNCNLQPWRDKLTSS